MEALPHLVDVLVYPPVVEEAVPVVKPAEEAEGRENQPGVMAEDADQEVGEGGGEGGQLADGGGGGPGLPEGEGGHAGGDAEHHLGGHGDHRPTWLTSTCFATFHSLAGDTG